MQKKNNELTDSEAFWYHYLTFDVDGEEFIEEGGSNTSKQVEAQRNSR